MAGEEPDVVSVRIEVRSLASLSGLRIQHFGELWYRSQTRLRPDVAMAMAIACSCSFYSNLSLGISKCCRRKEKKKENSNYKVLIQNYSPMYSLKKKMAR